MKAVAVLCAALCVLLGLFAAPSSAKLLTIYQFPHFQTFDSWETCWYDGVCYEQRCDNLPAGWYNPTFKTKEPCCPDIQIRHWWVYNQQTPSNWDTDAQPVDCNDRVTGPCADHTSGVPEGGNFLYAESSACPDVTFYVITPTLVFNNTGAIMSFWFYMYGDDINQSPTAHIDVYLSENNGTDWTMIHSVPSSQRQTNVGNPWKPVTIDLDAEFTGGAASSGSPVAATFRFVAVTGGNGDANWKSDIAIDDVLWTQDDAPNVTEPYIEPNETEPTPPIVASPSVGTEGGDGLTDGEIAGIVVGIVGGACLLCCLLTLLLIGLLLIISPRKPPQGGGGDGL